VDFETVKLALGAEICEWRRLRNISQEKFAEESTVHVNEVGKVERAETNPELKTLFLIATQMKMSLAVLFTAAEKRWREEHGEGVREAEP
jgi:transcriptional regulator with XRE-family HTH domain